MHGIIIGKFLPLHKGHEYLIRFAQSFTPSLTVVVDCIENESVAPSIRANWIKELFPTVNVVALKTPTPQQPSDHKDFWNFWAITLTNSAPTKITHLFASETYGVPLAAALKCQFIHCNYRREVFQISATSFKADPIAKWDYLSIPAQRYFTKKVRILGPESTGKTTLAHRLATHFSATAVPEFAKEYIELNPDLTLEDMSTLAKGQLASITAATFTQRHHPFLFIDSCALTTKIWSETLFQTLPPDFPKYNQEYEVTFLIYPSTPWVPDIHRNLLPEGQLLESRLHMFNRFRDELATLNCIPIILNGDFETNFTTAVNYLSSYEHSY